MVKLSVIAAEYGTTDVTAKLVEHFAHNFSGTLTPCNDIFGDPLPGIVKDFWCKLEIDNKIVEFKAQENERIVLFKNQTDRLAVYYTNNNNMQVIGKTLDHITQLWAKTRHFDLVTCSHQPLLGWPFPNILSLYQVSGHITLRLQVLQALLTAETLGDYQYVSFLEHDVMYPPDYFDYPNFSCDYICNQNYMGVKAEGFQHHFNGDFQVLSQVTMRFAKAKQHFLWLLTETLKGNYPYYIEPSYHGYACDLPYRTQIPAIHINRPSLTGHESNFKGEFIPVLDYWGHYSKVWI